MNQNETDKMKGEWKQLNGHEQLIHDLVDLIDLARAFEFHDFKGHSFDFPKVELANRLEIMRMSVINGKYDNRLHDNP